MAYTMHITGCMPENWEKALAELAADLGFTYGETGTEVRAV